jgi:hypothetical protein
MPKRHRRAMSLSLLSTRDIQAEIDRRQAEAEAIRSQRDAIARQIAELDRRIGDLGGDLRRGTGKRRGRRRGSTNKVNGTRTGKGSRRGRRGGLADVLHRLLQGRTLSVPEMAAAAKKAGHKTKSKNFNTVVGLTLINHKNRFKRVSRGQYTAR